MNRLFLSLIMLPLCFPAASNAQEACRNGVSELLTVEDYSVAAETGSYSDMIRLHLELNNRGERGVRMIDGSIVFQDVLGRDIIRIGIEPDLKIDGGGVVSQDGLYSNLRLLDVAKEDIVITTCIRGVVYSDGEVFKVETK